MIQLPEQKENLSDDNIQKVIGLLEPQDGSKPITKKDACAILGIFYNTARLSSIISNYLDKKEYEKQRVDANKGKPATGEEIQYILQNYCISGESIPQIAKAIYRPSYFVKEVLEKAGAPIKSKSYDYFSPTIVPEEAARERFDLGEVVFCAKYNVNAIVKSEKRTKKYGYVYWLWLLGDWQQFAAVAAYDLASLEHLKQYGVKIHE